MKHVQLTVLMLNEFFTIVNPLLPPSFIIDFLCCCLVCQKIVQQRYGFGLPSLSSNRSLTPQTISNITQQQSPVSNQVRLISNSHSVPSSSYVAGNINLAQTAPASVFSSYPYQQEVQQPILMPPNQQTTNGVLKDRNNQQQQQNQNDKRTRSFKEPTGNKLSTLNEMQPLPTSEGQVRRKSSFPEDEKLFFFSQTNEQLTPTSTPTQKRKETKRKSNIFTVNL